jgi:anti-anti-sigma regulatory factor
MLKLLVEQSGGPGSLVIEGEMVVDHADQLKKTFLDELAKKGSLDLNLEGVGKVDLFGLQVLCSAHCSALKADKALTLVGKQPEALRDAVAESGYGCTATCSANKTCPWNKK